MIRPTILLKNRSSMNHSSFLDSSDVSGCDERAIALHKDP